MRYFRWFRWVIFWVALAIDLGIFWVTEAFTAKSFIAAGTAALLMYVVVVAVSTRFKARRRIEKALVTGEKIIHNTGYHWVRLLWMPFDPKAELGASVLIPLGVAAATTLYFLAMSFYFLDKIVGLGLLGWMWIFYDVLPGDWHWAISGLYVLLLFAIPHTIYYVVAWSRHRYVITNERVITHDGILDKHMQNLTLERVVDSEFHLSVLQWFFGYGDLEFHLMAGGEEGEILECVNDPEKFDKVRREMSRDREKGGVH